MKPKRGRPPLDDPRVVVSFRLSGAVARALDMIPRGMRSKLVDEALASWLIERVGRKELKP